MKRTILVSLALAVFAFCLPFLFVPGHRGGDQSGAQSGTVETAEPSPETGPRAETALLDEDIVFTALIDGESVSVSMHDYLPGTLAGEMPASFDMEALKAQAVSARTYILYKMQRENTAHPEADVCGDPQCCKAYLTDAQMRENWGEGYETNLRRMQAAVESTDGEYLAYEGEAILAVFHSSSAGMTEASGSIWGDVPYLVSVDSPETEENVPNFVAEAEVAEADFKASVSAAYPDAVLGEEAKWWIGEATRDDSGRVASLNVGGVQIPGTVIRTMFGLRSTAFTVEYTGGRFVFTTTGFGHGVGMSQYGANIMAGQGADYREILMHYYPGTELVK